MPVPIDSSNPQYNDALLNRFFLSPKEKLDRENGKKIMRTFYQSQTSTQSTLNFFRLRNARQIELLQWAKGSQRMAEFVNFMGVSDANKSWINIDMEQNRVAPQFVGTLIESMAKNIIYPCVKAVDDGSTNEKEKRLQDALFRMHEVQTINDVEQASGMHLESPTAHVPDDEFSAKIYYELEDRLPKEIRFEEYLECVKRDISFDLVANRNTISSLIVLNGAFTKIERISPGEYTIRVCVNTNMVYNFFMSDNGKQDCDMIGEFRNIKVKDFRRQFGKSAENPDGLDEQEIFELARLSNNQSVGKFNYMWDQNWASTTYYLNRPYDDFSILCLDAEIDMGEDVMYVEKTDNYGRQNYERRDSNPYEVKNKKGEIVYRPKSENTNLISRRKNSWMRGMYVPYGDRILYWGRPDLIINRYSDYSRPLSSYTANIPNNDGEYVPSLFERVIEPIRELQLAKLERKKLLAALRPGGGYRVDVETLRNIPIGNGQMLDVMEAVRIYNNTGIEIWSSKGTDPLQREAPPISNGTHDDSIEKIIGLTNVIQSIMSEIRQLLGVPSYRDGADVGDRTAAELAQSQNKSSFNVTDFILDADKQLWKDTFEKLCLLKWNDIVKSEPESATDMINTRFDVSVEMKLTEYEKEILEQDIQRFSQMPDKEGNPLLSPKDAIMLREIDNYKLACLYLDATVEKNRRNAIQDSMKLQAQNAQVQAQAAAQNNQQEAQMAADKQKSDKEMMEYKALQDMKSAIVTGMFQIAAKPDAQMPSWLPPILQQLVPNIVIPIAAENAQMQQNAQAAQQQMQQASQQPQQQPDQSQTQPPQQSQMQPQMQQ